MNEPRCPHERDNLAALIDRLMRLRALLLDRATPTHETTLQEWHDLLRSLKAIVGNSSNDMSFIAVLMAKDYLCRTLPMRSFDAGLKPQGASGPDIDELTTDGRRVIAEIKTTMPYNGPDLGAQQLATFKKDFDKLNTAVAELKFFFVTERSTFELMKRKYRSRIPSTTIVLLPEGETLAPPQPVESLSSGAPSALESQSESSRRLLVLADEASYGVEIPPKLAHRDDIYPIPNGTFVERHTHQVVGQGELITPAPDEAPKAND